MRALGVMGWSMVGKRWGVVGGWLEGGEEGRGAVRRLMEGLLGVRRV